MKVLHVRTTDASAIAKALQSFLQQKQLDVRKLIDQGYDSAATFAGKISGVHKDEFRPPLFMQSTSTVLVKSIQADASAMEIAFGSCFIISPQK